MSQKSCDISNSAKLNVTWIHQYVGVYNMDLNPSTSMSMNLFSLTLSKIDFEINVAGIS